MALRGADRASMRAACSCQHRKHSACHPTGASICSFLTAVPCRSLPAHATATQQLPNQQLHWLPSPPAAAAALDPSAAAPAARVKAPRRPGRCRRWVRRRRRNPCWTWSSLPPDPQARPAAQTAPNKDAQRAKHAMCATCEAWAPLTPHHPALTPHHPSKYWQAS